MTLLVSIFIGIAFGIANVALWLAFGHLMMKYRYRWLSGLAIIVKLAAALLCLWLFIAQWNVHPLGFLGGLSVAFGLAVLVAFHRIGKLGKDGRV